MPVISLRELEIQLEQVEKYKQTMKAKIKEQKMEKKALLEANDSLSSAVTIAKEKYAFQHRKTFESMLAMESTYESNEETLLALQQEINSKNAYCQENRGILEEYNRKQSICQRLDTNAQIVAEQVEELLSIQELNDKELLQIRMAIANERLRNEQLQLQLQKEVNQTSNGLSRLQNTQQIEYQ